jgi:hypothetical protein
LEIDCADGSPDTGSLIARKHDMRRGDFSRMVEIVTI